MVVTAGLRERKKLDSRRAIASVALDLAIERGPDEITVEDIAAAAHVSPRTVFNHFGTKDEAILGIDPERRTALVVVLVDLVDEDGHRGHAREPGVKTSSIVGVEPARQ